MGEETINPALKRLGYDERDRVVPPDNGAYMVDRTASTAKRLLRRPDSYQVRRMDTD